MSTPKPGRLLIVDDELELLNALREMLVLQGYEVVGVASARQARQALETGHFDLLLTDLRMPDMNGIDLLRAALELDPDLVGVVMTGHGTVQTAVEAMRAGAFDYVLKPFDFDRVLPVLSRALDVRRLRLENVHLREAARLYEQARQSAESYRLVLENVDEIIYRVNVGDDPFRGIVQFVSRRVENIIGYKPEEFYEDAGLWARLIHPDDAPMVAAQTEAIYAGRQGGAREFRLRHKATGEYRWMEDRVLPQFDEAGKMIGIFGVAHDVTERKQRDREREAIITMANALRAAPTRADMFPVILDQVLEILHAQGAALAMRDPATGDTVVELARGEFVSALLPRLPPGEGVSGHVLTTGAPYLNNDVRSEPRFAWSGLLKDIRAAACVPLIAQGQAIGVLCLGRKNDIAPEEVRLLSAIADMAANAIHRTTLHEQTERNVRRLTALRTIDTTITASLDLRLTLSVVLDQVTMQLGVDAADVLLFDAQLQMLDYAAGRGFRNPAAARSRVRLGEEYAGRAALERRLVQVPNLAEGGLASGRAGLLVSEGFVAYFGVPLVAKGSVKGVLELFHRAPLTPDPEWLDFLETIGGQAAVAIDDAELFEGLQRSNAELALAYDATIEGWSRALDLRDKETEGHTRRVTEMTLKLSQAMGVFNEAALVHVRRGALLHDIGKMGIPDGILLKPGPLTDEEWAIMRQHPAYAHDLLSSIAFLRPALDIPYSHHEKWDGTGYPRGLKGRAIPLAARLFAVADVWDALRSDRPYRPAWPEEKVRDYLHRQSGLHFDPEIVETFLTALGGEPLRD